MKARPPLYGAYPVELASGPFAVMSISKATLAELALGATPVSSIVWPKYCHVAPAPDRITVLAIETSSFPAERVVRVTFRGQVCPPHPAEAVAFTIKELVTSPAGKLGLALIFVISTTA